MAERGEVFNFLMGLLVLVVAGIFVSIVYSASDDKVSTKGHYTLRAEFKSSDGIVAGSSVQISGVQVGKVYKKVLDPGDYAAIVFILVDDGVKIPSDSLAAISTDGLFGTSYIELRPGKDSKMLSNNEEIIYTRDSVNVYDMISKLSRFLK